VAANAAPKIATPNAPPSWRMVVNAPDAVPMSAGGTVLVTDLVAAGMASASPAPMMVIGVISTR
jgi:hypothetical protein